MSDSLRYRGAPARREAIRGLLEATGFLSTREIAARLDISEMTARRDLRRLAEHGVLDLVRGGARLASIEAAGLEGFTSRVSREQAAKEHLGRAAGELVGSTDVIAIDAGTTAFQVANQLPETFTGTLISHSVPVIELMTARTTGRGIAIGGEVFQPSQALVGSAAATQVLSLSADTVFLGAGGVNERGIFISADVERGVKKALISIARRVVLVIDHAKFESTAAVLLCSWTDIDLLVTDREPVGRVAASIADAGVQAVVRPMPDGTPS